MFKNAFDVFSFLGFKIRIDPSWLLIAALIIWSLSSSYFPGVLPGYSDLEYIALGTLSMIGLFVSLVLHELSHSLVARRFGLKVGSITLFVFGGVAELESEPQSPKSEFWIAIAGPTMSFVLAALAWAIAQLIDAAGAPSPLRVVFEYLGLVNFILALFNLVPAFPLDGGRVFRALLWRIKGDILPATRTASTLGSMFGVFLIGSGVFSLFSTNIVAGFWQILIGFFVIAASRGSYRKLQISAALKNHSVLSLMSSPVFCADADDTVDAVINDVILKRNVTLVPVIEDNHLLGYVSTKSLKDIEKANWASTKLGDVYVVSDSSNTVSPDDPTEGVFERMLRTGQSKVMVGENGKLVGILALADLMKYLAIREGLDVDKTSKTGIEKAT